jgi:uncharacterized protein YecE (DUF72 family)
VIRIGVAGWDYPDWNGIVYPARAGSRFDKLSHVAHFVDVVEINSTFYRPATPSTSAAWVRRTERFDRFRFTAKAHRSWTHEAGAVLPDTVRDTLAGLTPIREAGRLGAVLLQFPQSFHFNLAARERLQRLAGLAEGWPLVVEVRHVSWGVDEAIAWLGSFGLGWCAVDQPRTGPSTLGILPRVLGSLGYLRLHGRNSRDWFRPDAGRDARYDYLYDEREIAAFRQPVESMAAAAADVFVVQNNHFRGKALVNALQLRRLLEGRRPQAPRELVAAYPELAPLVRGESDRLF